MRALPTPATMGMITFKGCWLLVAGVSLEEEHEFARINTKGEEESNGVG
jgi:hypothetical protein